MFYFFRKHFIFFPETGFFNEKNSSLLLLGYIVVWQHSGGTECTRERGTPARRVKCTSRYPRMARRRRRTEEENGVRGEYRELGFAALVARPTRSLVVVFGPRRTSRVHSPIHVYTYGYDGRAARLSTIEKGERYPIRLGRL